MVMDINLIITEVRNKEGGFSDREDHETIKLEQLLKRLHELANEDEEYEHGLIISFPKEELNTIRVEIYNGYRE
ncbi:hypothetical protein D1872_113950 [compost metagenome]